MRALLIEVRLLEPRYHGDADWPPSPGRLFQALVAGAYGGRWAAEDPAWKDAALRWLEALPPPHIAAPPSRPGRATRYWVPNNSLDSRGGDPARIAEIRTAKTVTPRLLEAEPVLLFAWPFPAGQEETAEAVARLAGRLHRLGRGPDAAFARAEVTGWTQALARLEAHGGAPSRPVPGAAAGADDPLCPIPGTLDSLKRRHAAWRAQFRPGREGRKPVLHFERPPKPLLSPVAYDRPPARLLFEIRGENGAFAAWPLARAAALAEAVRDGAAALLSRRLPERAGAIERLLVGRGAGEADKSLRPRIVPLPSIGTARTDADIRRVLLEVPADCPLPLSELSAALGALDLSMAPDTGELAEGGGPVLVRTEDRRMAAHYRIALGGEPPRRPVRHWRTVTPAALPVARARGRLGGASRRVNEAEAAAAVHQALRHAGIAARPFSIRVQREPWTVKGERAERFALPAHLKSRTGDGAGAQAGDRLWHVAVTFEEPIAGPLLIGDGRWLGLGLMMPGAPPDEGATQAAGDPPDLLAFPLNPALRPPASRAGEVAQAVRRALMSLARRPDGGVHPLFSGHLDGPGPARPGDHRHVYLAAEDADGDGRLDRVLVIAPWRVDRSWTPDGEERRGFRQVAERLTRVTAGPLGVLELGAPEAVPPEAGRVWRSVTPYHPTRHPRRHGDPAAFLAEDVKAECRRRHVPEPAAVEVEEMERGPRGGLSARLILRFAGPVTGPLVLGRTAHQGGGRFAAIPSSDPV